MTKARSLASAANSAVNSTELGYLDGVTSAIQTQIDAKAPTSTAVTLTGTQTLTNKTLTSPVISSISNTGTVTLPTATDTLVGRATTDTLTNKTLTSPALNIAALTAPTEIGQQLNTAGGAMNVDVTSGTFLFYTGTTTANFTLNFRGNSSTTLASLLAVGQPITVSVMVNNTTAYYMTALTIDGASPALTKWSGGTAPSAGNASSYDVYSFTIWKYAATPNFAVFAAGPVKYA